MKVRVGCTQPVKDISMNPFCLYQDPSSNASPQTAMTTNRKRMGRIERKLNEECILEMINTKYSTGRVSPDAQPETYTDYVIAVDDDNDYRKVLHAVLGTGLRSMCLIHEKAHLSRHRNRKRGEILDDVILRQ